MDEDLIDLILAYLDINISMLNLPFVNEQLPVFTLRHENSNYKTFDSTEILLSRYIRAAQNYYSCKFSPQMGSWFCDRLRLNF